MQIVFKEYPQWIQTANKRRKKFFKSPDSHSVKRVWKELPKKYQDSTRYEFRVIKSEYILVDKASKEPVVKNSKAAGTPKRAYINGNELMRMFEHTRNKIVRVLKESFYPPLLESFPQIGKRWNQEEEKEYPIATPLKYVNYPISISLEVSCPVGLANWDVDNMWIYTKCFQDALVDLQIIPGDSVRYIAESGSVRFIPVQDEGQRKLVFTLKPCDHSRYHGVLKHVLWELQLPLGYIQQKPEMVCTLVSVIPWPGSTLLRQILIFKETTEGKAGSIFVDFKKSEVFVSVGKKKTMFGSVKDAITNIAMLCVQSNRELVITEEQLDKYPFFQSEIIDKRIPLYILTKNGSRTEVPSEQQDDTNQVHPDRA